MSNIYIITGQTATGKTNYALNLAKECNGEIINCDSRQIYKHLDIITGKDLGITTRKFHKVDELNTFDIGYYLTSSSNSLPIKIWLYDVIEPSMQFSSYDFSLIARKLIKSMISQHKTPIIVGGTYHYMKNILYGFDVNVQPNWTLRKKLNTYSLEHLKELLKEKAPETYEQLNKSDRNNPHRLIRKIEISQSKPANKKPEQNLIDTYNIEFTGFKYTDNNQLRTIIKARVEKRIQLGAVEEVKNIMNKGYIKTDPGLQTIGYKQVIEYLESKISYKEMKTIWITKEVQYAKRQLTFMKKDKHITWENII